MNKAFEINFVNKLMGSKYFDNRDYVETIERKVWEMIGYHLNHDADFRTIGQALHPIFTIRTRKSNVRSNFFLRFGVNRDDHSEVDKSTKEKFFSNLRSIAAVIQDNLIGQVVQDVRFNTDWLYLYRHSDEESTCLPLILAKEPKDLVGVDPRNVVRFKLRITNVGYEELLYPFINENDSERRFEFDCEVVDAQVEISELFCQCIACHKFEKYSEPAFPSIDELIGAVLMTLFPFA